MTAAVLLAAGLAVAGTVGWTAHARSAERAEAGRRAGEFLADADRLEQAGRWAEALALVEQAEAMPGATADAGLHDRVRYKKRVLALVLRAEAIRLEMAAFRDAGPDFGLGDRPFAQAFREYGLDVDALTPADIAARLPEGAARGEVVAALDDWAPRPPRRPGGSRPGVGTLAGGGPGCRPRSVAGPDAGSLAGYADLESPQGTREPG